MSSVTAAAIAAALSSTSCLVGHRTLQADAETTPLIPPSIIEGQTSPLPGQMILISDTDPPTLAFTVKVARTTVIDADHPIEARVFTDRQRLQGCGSQCMETGAPGNCTSDSDGGQFRTCRFTRSFSRGCHYVDFYVSSQFQPGFSTEPEREGDIAHVRWFVARQLDTGDYPSTADCLEHPPVQP